MEPAERKKREEHPNTKLVERLRERYQVQNALPPKYQDCVVKLERIDISEYQASTANRSNGSHTLPSRELHPLFRVRRKSELEYTDEPVNPVRRTIKIEHEDTPDDNGVAVPSARYDIVLKPERDRYIDVNIAGTSIYAEIANEPLPTNPCDLLKEIQVLNNSLDKIIEETQERLNIIKNEKEQLRLLCMKLKS